MTDAVIAADTLSLKTGHRYLLRDITWSVPKGENWIVFGMNGSGKTTLLSILAGFKQPTSGQVQILGEQYNKENVLSLRQRIGWVSASFFDQQYTRESVQDIVLSGRFGTLGLTRPIKDCDIKRARMLLKAFHLGEKIDRPFHVMSKGERQNVLIARAMMAEPEILLLDEPCTGLDVLAREQFLDTLSDIAYKNELTIIYVTHHTDEILFDIFKKALFLKNGSIFAQGNAQRLFTSETLSEFFDAPVTISTRAGHGLETTVAVNKKGGLLR